ncbi:MAG: ATPase [Ruminococcus sp.]|nr:ATPase [Ruminococcus sp.]
MQIKDMIAEGSTSLGIEFGSTRIKAVLTDLSGSVLAVGAYDWENTLSDGLWTYPIEEIHKGLRGCYASLKKAVNDEYGVTLRKLGAVCISAMMHGFLAFDKEGNLLTPFRTWRNTNTQAAADELTELFSFNIPLRWTVSHLYQAILDGEPFVKDIDRVTVLSSYIHCLLTGEYVVGIGDASGIFPIDKLCYDRSMMTKLKTLLAAKGFDKDPEAVFPKILTAGEQAGTLTKQGAAFLDPEGDLEAGTPFAPPEGDAGTGMTATNSVAPATGNVSAGTSTFAMLVLEKGLTKLHREIDMVTTPDGAPVAMSHANNGTSDLNAWVRLFGEALGLFGVNTAPDELYEKLYKASLEGDPDCGGLMSYGYYSGESITGLESGRPLFMRKPDAAFTIQNFMRAHLYSSLAAVKMGMDILLKEEGARVGSMTAHGGLFKTEGVGQRYLAAAMGAPVTVMETAGEGGPWGAALLGLYMLKRQKSDISLPDYLSSEIFLGAKGSTVTPTEEEIQGFESFMEAYRSAVPAERSATETFI